MIFNNVLVISSDIHKTTQLIKLLQIKHIVTWSGF